MIISLYAVWEMLGYRKQRSALAIFWGVLAAAAALSAIYFFAVTGSVPGGEGFEACCGAYGNG